MNALGLTLLEAKVYLALVEAGQASAKTISKLSKVYQPDIYRIAPKLEKAGLIEKIISNPTEYRAKPIDEAIAMLIQSKNQQITLLKNKTKKILEKYEEKNQKKISPEEKTDLILIPEGRRNIHKIGTAISQSQKSFISIGTHEIFRKAKYLDEQIWIEAIKRGVKFRFILDKPKNSILIPKFTGVCTRKDYFEVRYVNFEPPATVILIDGKEGFVRTERNIESPVLWISNPCIIEMINQYLEAMWEKAKEYNL